MRQPKLLLIVTFCLLLAGCTAEKKQQHNRSPSYIIEGNVTGFPDGTKFYLYSLETNANVDSAIISKNSLKMEGHIANPPGNFWLRTEGEDFVYTPLLIGNDSLTLTADKADFGWNVKTSGSKIDSNYRRLMYPTKDLSTKRDSLIFAFHRLPSKEKERTMESFLERVEKIDQEISQIELDLVRKTSDTYAGMLRLGHFMDQLPRDTVRIIYNRYSDELKQSKFGKVVQIYLESSHVEIGDKYLDFTALDQRGNETSLSELWEEEKFLLINYTSAYCGACITANDGIREIYSEYQSTLNIVDFSADPQKKDWKNSIERDANPWPSLWDGKGRYSESAIRYNFSATPTFLLISPDGRIVDRWVGYSQEKLKSDLENYLKESA